MYVCIFGQPFFFQPINRTIEMNWQWDMQISGVAIQQSFNAYNSHICIIRKNGFASIFAIKGIYRMKMKDWIEWESIYKKIDFPKWPNKMNIEMAKREKCECFFFVFFLIILGCIHLLMRAFQVTQIICVLAIGSHRSAHDKFHRGIYFKYHLQHLHGSSTTLPICKLISIIKKWCGFYHNLINPCHSFQVSIITFHPAIGNEFKNAIQNTAKVSLLEF